MNLAQLIDYLSRDQEFQSNLTKWTEIKAKPAHYAPFPKTLDKKIVRALEEKGITELYTHQATAFEHIQKGENVVVVTPTASGKTMTYNLPVLNHLIANPEARALYLFPTKALSQDQLKEVQDLNERLELGAKTFTFDGDTPADVRRTIRSPSPLEVRRSPPPPCSLIHRSMPPSVQA